MNKLFYNIIIPIFILLLFNYAAVGIVIHLKESVVTGQIWLGVFLFLTISLYLFFLNYRNAFAVINIFLTLYLFYYVFGAFYMLFNGIHLIDIKILAIIVISLLFSASGITLIGNKKVFFSSDNPKYKVFNNTKIYLHLSFLASIFFSCIWWYRVGGIPIFAEDVEYARVELAQGTFLNRQLMGLFIPFYLIYFFDKVSSGGNLLKSKSLVFYFVIGSFLLLSQGYRTFMLSFWVILLIIYSSQRRFTLLSMRSMAIGLGTLSFIFIFGAYRFFSAEYNSGDERTTLEVLYNTFFVRPVAVEDILNVFPETLDYQGLSTYIRGLNFVIPIYDKGLGVWLKDDVLFKEFAGAGYNPGVIGEFLIAFGLNALFVCMFIYGLVITFLLKLRYSNVTSVNVSIKATILFYLLLSMSPGISTTLFSILWAVALLYIASFILQSKLRLS